ncbi:helix-turn-helix domain-containing protein [Oleiagrimonas sp. C23AA]|uniref:helix-turn-helix domain-containing protein n=1 Tax=Oleiagrimonas sp. C23AA TaxID=2719047 RepID=UPI001F10F8F2|nr:helix-turn-helix domain-containing protein [Oleiagrimonas sp. C23AA]
MQVSRLEKGQYLVRAGDAFRSLYLLSSGSAKAFRVGYDGREQVTRFYLAEDLLGLDAMNRDVHPTFIRALEYSVVVEVPLRQLEQLGVDTQGLQRELIRQLAREVERDQAAMLLLGSTSAEERIASFVLDLSRRHASRGHSGVEYVLRMTREDIASYLGVKLETVSRGLSRFHRAGVLEVRGRHITITDRARLGTFAAWDADIEQRRSVA